MRQMCKKLAVFFPGIGYTLDKPLMHYSRKLTAMMGYEIKLLPYSGFPPKIKGDRAKMEESFRIALEQSEEMLAGIDLQAYDDILFIGKSIGTIAAAKISSESPVADKIRLILYTPLEATFAFPMTKAIAFTGTKDPWVGNGEYSIADLCEQRRIPCYLIKGGNHSLETEDTDRDLRKLRKIMKKTKKFIEFD